MEVREVWTGIHWYTLQRIPIDATARRITGMHTILTNGHATTCQ